MQQNVDRIEILLPDQSTRVVEITTTELTVGHEADNVIALEDTLVSRYHTKITFDGTNYHVTDLGSTNGTFLERERLAPHTPVAWMPGQRLRVGHVYLQLVQVSHAAPSVPEPSAPVMVHANGAPVNPSLIRFSAGEGRIGLFVDVAHLRVTPGESVALPVMVLNRGTENDTFTLSVEGVPADWVSPVPPLSLAPRQQREVTLTIRPPRESRSRAGRHSMMLRVSSRRAPGQVVENREILTVAPYTQFSSDLHPQRLQAGGWARVTVNNQGNIRESFTARGSDPADDVRFSPPEVRMAVDAGQTETAEFTVTPRQRRWLGGEQEHPFTVRVGPAQGEPQTHHGDLVSKGSIPTWALGVMAGLILIAAAVIAVGPGTRYMGAARATKTAVANLTATAQNIDAAVTPYPTVLVTTTLPITPTLTPEPTETPLPGHPKVTLFVVEPGDFVRGTRDTIQLKWKTEEADKVTIEGIGLVGTTGERTIVAPEADTTYLLVAENIHGETKAQAKVTVSAFKVEISEITMSPLSAFCPTTLYFTATIKANGTGTASYAWVRDLNIVESQSIELNADAKTISWRWEDFKDQDPHTVGLRTTKPNELWKQKEFTFDCLPPLITVFASDPSEYTYDEKPETITLLWATEGAKSAQIEKTACSGTNGSCEVNAPDQTTIYKLVAENVVGEQVSRETTVFVSYKVDNVSVYPFTFDSMCPATIPISGTISTNGPIERVEYQWKDNYNNFQNGSVKFEAAGSKTIETTWTLSSSKNYSIKLLTLSPNQLEEQPAVSITCQDLKSASIIISDSIDLDDSSNTADIGFYEVAGTESITATSGVLIATISALPLQKAGCETILTSEPVNLIPVKENAYICVKTSEQKYALVKLGQITGTDANRALEIQFIRWE